MMMGSREAVVNYMTPLGLAHLMASDHHYGPGLWVNDQPARCGTRHTIIRRIGAASASTALRTAATLSRNTHLKSARCFADLKCVSDKYLLWFHHVPWNYRLRSGETVWNSLISHYDRRRRDGCCNERAMGGICARSWMRERHASVAAKLNQQLAEAKWWRDASIAYWQSLSNLPLPKGHKPPRHPLSWYKSIHFDTVPGFLGPTDRAMLVRSFDQRRSAMRSLDSPADCQRPSLSRDVRDPPNPKALHSRGSCKAESRASRKSCISSYPAENLQDRSTPAPSPMAMDARST